MRRRLLFGIALLVLAILVGTYPKWVPSGYEVNLPLPTAANAETARQAVREGRIQVPPEFTIDLYAQVRGARMMRATSRGDLLVSSPGAGEIVLLEADEDGSGEPDGARVLLRGLRRPHGLDIHDGWLYVAETHAIGRIRFDVDSRELRGEYSHVRDDLPPGGNHWTRTLRVGPDGKLYVSVGSSCNVCLEKDERRGTIVRYDLDGQDEEIFASGLRNAVGFAWQPETGALFATDNGRDHLGDDFPPCELNRVTRGAFYGWPFVNGNGRPDPDFGARGGPRAEAAVDPVHGFGAHQAPLGLAFIGPSWPAPYRGAALVALHGSWNRSRKAGYKVSALHWQENGSIVERDFVWGFLKDGDVVGRPVDVVEGPRGAVYVSDDFANAVYRILPR